MKAAVIHALGQPPRFEDFPEPTAGEGEVGVNGRAACFCRHAGAWQTKQDGDKRPSGAALWNETGAWTWL